MKSLRDDMLAWGRRPQTPGIYRFRARMDAAGRPGFGGGRSRLQPFRQLSRRSGCVPAEPYPPLSYPQSGLHQPCRAILLQRTATTPLTDCLTFGVHFKLPIPYSEPRSGKLQRISLVRIFHLSSAIRRPGKLLRN